MSFQLQEFLILYNRGLHWLVLRPSESCFLRSCLGDLVFKETPVLLVASKHISYPSQKIFYTDRQNPNYRNSSVVPLRQPVNSNLIRNRSGLIWLHGPTWSQVFVLNDRGVFAGCGTYSLGQSTCTCRIKRILLSASDMFTFLYGQVIWDFFLVLN